MVLRVFQVTYILCIIFIQSAHPPDQYAIGVPVIDAFSHFMPLPVLQRCRELAPANAALRMFEALPELWDLDARLRSLEPFPRVQQVLSFANPPVETFGSAATAAELARLANTELASICAAHPDRFPAFTAVLPMSDVSLAMSELNYAHRELGARGIQIYTSVLGSPLSRAEFRPVFAAMAELNLPVLVHPYRTAAVADYAGEGASEAEVWFSFGWPYETSAFAARMVYSGIFDELPDLKLLLHHYGGMIPSFSGRLELGFRQIFGGPGGVNPVAEEAGITQPVIAYFQRFYADTALNGSLSGVRNGFDFFGPSRSLFGTDSPFSPDGGPAFVASTLAAIDALGLSARDRYQVVEGNARSLFGLPAPDGADEQAMANAT